MPGAQRAAQVKTETEIPCILERLFAAIALPLPGQTLGRHLV